MGRSDNALSCRHCERILLAWLPVPGVPDGAMLLGHLSARHHEVARALLEQIHTVHDIALVALQAFEVEEVPEC